MRKLNGLLLVPVLAITLTGCYNSNATKSQTTNTKATKSQTTNTKAAQSGQTTTPTKGSTDPLKDANLSPQSGQSEANWLHTNGNQIVKTITKSSGPARLAYAKGFSNGSDDGVYTWNNKYHQQSAHASNSITDANATNGVINVDQMNNQYYRLGWILSNAQGAVSQDSGNYRGQMSEQRYTSAIAKFNAGKAFSHAKHETKYVAYDDGINKWFTHEAASLNDPNFN